MNQTTCDGCECWDEAPARPYLVTYHDGTSERVRYCDECADLARIDWNGETQSIQPENAR